MIRVDSTGRVTIQLKYLNAMQDFYNMFGNPQNGTELSVNSENIWAQLFKALLA